MRGDSMNSVLIRNVNVESFDELPISPLDLEEKYPVTGAAANLVWESREDLKRIFWGKDPRLVVVAGPCSIHDETAAYDYARRLAALKAKVKDRILLIMRVYHEKPRTTIGWKGLVNDPFLDGTYDVAAGLELVRKIQVNILDIGVPIATEFIDPAFPPFLADPATLSCIGARNAESNTQRQMASGLSSVVGFKHDVIGNLQVAVNGIIAASNPAKYPSVTPSGRIGLVSTTGNKFCFPIVRGGKQPNYYAYCLDELEKLLVAAKLMLSYLVDCSHGNSRKDHKQQADVFDACLCQRKDGRIGIKGLMLESNINAGKQNIKDRPLRYGVSVTDACIDWQTTEGLIMLAYKSL